ncbi:P2Y purinoceptor 6 isoform X1 [Arapaima gigas]
MGTFPDITRTFEPWAQGAGELGAKVTVREVVPGEQVYRTRSVRPPGESLHSPVRQTSPSPNHGALGYDTHRGENLDGDEEYSVFHAKRTDLTSSSCPLTGGMSPQPTACTYKESFKLYLLPTIYGVVFLLGVPLNASVILRIWRTRATLNRSSIYMLNLAVADLLYASSLPLLVLYHSHRDYWPFGNTTCKLVRFQFYSNLHGSIFFLTVISVERCLGVCWPLAAWRLRQCGGGKPAWIVSLAVWAAVLVLCYPTLSFASTGIQRNRTVCYDLCEPGSAARYLPYGIALTALGFVVPFMVVVTCYCRMARVLSQSGFSAGLRKRRQALRMIAVVVVLFVVSFLPFHLTKTAYLRVYSLRGVACEVRNTYSVIYKSTRPFASMNSITDPFLFFFTQTTDRRAIGSMLPKQLITQEVNMRT